MIIYDEVAIIATWIPATVTSNRPNRSVPRLEIPIVLDEIYLLLYLER